MISKASVAKHTIHPMLVPLPIGLWIFSLGCDFLYEVIGGLLAALPGQKQPVLPASDPEYQPLEQARIAHLEGFEAEKAHGGEHHQHAGDDEVLPPGLQPLDL